MNWKRWIVTCFGLGWLPMAPGSWGSLPPALVFGLLMYAGAPAAATVVMAVMLVVGCVACVLYAPASIAAKGDDDPGEVVMDEFAAQALTFLILPLVATRGFCGWECIVLAGVGFVAFRAIDIVKPWPIRRAGAFAGRMGYFGGRPGCRGLLGDSRIRCHEAVGQGVAGWMTTVSRSAESFRSDFAAPACAGRCASAATNLGPS